MNIEDTYRYLVGAYYGIAELDEYSLKEYLLKDIENYIIEYVNQNKKDDIDYLKIAHDIEDHTSLKVKLQDSLLVLPKVNAPMEVVFMVKARLRKIRDEELDNM